MISALYYNKQFISRIKWNTHIQQLVYISTTSLRKVNNMPAMGRCSVMMLTDVITLYYITLHYIYFKLQDYSWFILMISGDLEKIQQQLSYYR